MAIKMKRSAVAAKVPLVTDLNLGELAVNTHDGKLFLKKDDGTEKIVDVSGDLKSYAHDTLTAGFDSDVQALGTITSGTITPEVDADAKENFKTLTNGGAFTLAPPSSSSACTILIQVTNNASAGAITTSGFTIVNGDDYETTDGNDYFFHIKKIGSFSSLTIEALQ